MSTSTESKTYNGWTNYETWNVALWLDNEQGSQRHWAAESQSAWNAAVAPSANARLTGHEPFTREQRAVFVLADQIKSEIEESMPELGASMWSDLLNGALSEVNWREIAEHYIADCDHTEEEGTDEAD